MLWESVGQTLLALSILLFGIPLGICLVVELGAMILDVPGPLARLSIVFYEWLFRHDE